MSSQVKLCPSALFILFITTFNAIAQQPIHNPVLPGVADAGVFKFNGEYYIGGVFTNGSFYRSDNLVDWEGPFHVFSMDNAWTEDASAGDDQIHASDLNYVNGVFHHYWSVNYWGKDKHVVHIGHATSDNVLGPYEEPVKDTWMTNRIDPHLFRDDNGKFYFYMVKFTDGNTIWGRPMKDPWTLSGEPRYLFASLPGTWETLDNRVAEGPWVIKYRDRYYMMYNANHTSPRYGNYALGVAEADSPLGFHHGSKYPYPVVKSNQIDLEDTYADLLQYTGKDMGLFLYTTDQPENDWYSKEFSASDWQQGRSGFGDRVIRNATTREVKTSWDSPELWVRKTFEIENDPENLVLRMHHDGATTVWLNGQPVYEGTGRKYLNYPLDENDILLQKGPNVVAVHSTRGERSNFLDVSLFDIKDRQMDDILFSPGQPNIVKGLNGFEWWLVYMANKNSDSRGQYINRIHFFNKRLVVDGITGPNTPGYHPGPSNPTFSALFNETKKLSPGDWETRGSVKIENKELLLKGSDEGVAMVKKNPAVNYLFETGVRIIDATEAGVYAWWQDEKNWVKVVLNKDRASWGYIVNKKGKPENHYFPLPAGFRYNAYHKISIYKNAETFTVKIDDLPPPQTPVFVVSGSAKAGNQGLFTAGTTAFDGVLYTIGWDEFDKNITGWGAAASGTKPKGTWSVSEKGLLQEEATGENFIFKGDRLDAYEISAQVTGISNNGSVGIYAVYIDEENFLKAAIDYKSQKLVITGREHGELIKAKEIELAKDQPYYADMSYSDFIEKHFTFHSPSYISGMRINKTPHRRPGQMIDDIPEKVNIFYKQDNSWYPLKWQEQPSEHPGFDHLTFDPVQADAIKIVNKNAQDHNFYTYKIWIDEEFKESYNFRIANRNGVLIFMLDGEELYRMKHNFPASQVGLFTNNMTAVFNGITLFDLNHTNHK